MFIEERAIIHTASSSFSITVLNHYTAIETPFVYHNARARVFVSIAPFLLVATRMSSTTSSRFRIQPDNTVGRVKVTVKKDEHTFNGHA